jgi:AcrR family transcriptional regulator
MTEPPRRRRGAALEADLLDATWLELAETGYAGLTMEGVAARAHTGKQVLYRRWPSRAMLVIAAVRHRTGSIAEDPPDTGELRADVLAVLERMVARLRDIGPEVLRGLIADACDIDPDLFPRMGNLMRRVLERAAERGEIPTADLPARVVSTPTDLLRHDMLVRGVEVSPDSLSSIVDDVFLPLVRHRPARPTS